MIINVQKIWDNHPKPCKVVTDSGDYFAWKSTLEKDGVQAGYAYDVEAKLDKYGKKMITSFENADSEPSSSGGRVAGGGATKVTGAQASASSPRYGAKTPEEESRMFAMGHAIELVGIRQRVAAWNVESGSRDTLEGVSGSSLEIRVALADCRDAWMIVFGGKDPLDGEAF